MTHEALVAFGQLVLSVVSGGLLVAVINTFLSPKTRAETRQVAQTVARQEVNDRIQNLKDSAEEAERRADRAEERISAVERKFEAAELEAAELRKQNNEYVATIAALERRLNQIEAALQEAQAQEELLYNHLEAAQEEVKVLKQQRSLLLAHIARVEDWHRSGRTGDMPILRPFDD